MKGIVLSGATHAALPIDPGGEQQLLPVYNKPMVYYRSPR